MNGGRLIKYHRQQKGWTQQQLADEMGTSKSVIGRLESSDHSPNLNTLLRVAAALDMTMSIGFHRKEKK